MTATAPSGTASPRVRRRTFLIAFAVIALVIAGIVSYFASSSPDGLDSATQRGCETSAVNGTEQLTGNCIAQHATDHAMASSPLADYSLRGIEYTNGIAGVIGVIVTLAIAGGLFWAIRRRPPYGSDR
ncbi:MAG: PDGLE domain-containing protein [Gordonia sp. (in: high G+C Gram-positive bacteria)]